MNIRAIIKSLVVNMNLLRVSRVLTTTRTISSQVTDRIFMIRPAAFSFNLETARDNSFQDLADANCYESTQASALREFDGLVTKLKGAGVDVTVFDDTTKVPDAVFPNNWISFHSGKECMKGVEGQVMVLFPMLSSQRRTERRKDITEHWTKVLGSEIRNYSSFEKEGIYLEGTGSMVLDRVNNVVYAGLSQRTHSTLLEKFCSDFQSKLVSFKAFSETSGGMKKPIYHTNVMMQISTSFAVICLDSITDIGERELVRNTVEGTGKEIVLVSVQQMSNFACNILQLRGTGGNLILVMSTRAFKAFTSEQLATFAKHSCSVVHSDLEVIEKCGGGGARCMIAEVFPPLLPQVR